MFAKCWPIFRPIDRRIWIYVKIGVESEFVVKNKQLLRLDRVESRKSYLWTIDVLIRFYLFSFLYWFMELYGSAVW